MGRVSVHDTTVEVITGECSAGLHLRMRLAKYLVAGKSKCIFAAGVLVTQLRYAQP